MKRILTLLFVLTVFAGNAQVQNAEPPTGAMRDSVVYETVFYFQHDIEWMHPTALDYSKMDLLLRWAKNDLQTPIVITGWADKTGTVDQNEKISLNRARNLCKYMVKQGIAPERISFEGRGVDTEAESNEKARRADVRGVIRLAMVAEPTDAPNKPAQITPVVAPQPAAQSEQDGVATEPTQGQTAVQPVGEPTHAKSLSKNKRRWYVGVEGGVSFGVSTLSSFTSEGGAGWNAGVLGGYRISPLLSAEIGASLGELKLGASNCCQDYFLGADGVRYLGHVAGMNSYSYRDIHSSVSMQQYALRLNVDMLQIVNPDWNKRWSLTLSPAIYGVNTTATLKSGNTLIIKRDAQFQFGAGAGIGVGCQITKNLGMGIRSGALWVFGKDYDGIAPTDHKENMIWNNTLTLTWRFGCNK